MFKTEIINGDSKLATTESVLAALEETATRDGEVHIRIDDGGFFFVTVLDGDEWGTGPDLDTALRYALGAHYAPEEL